MAEITSKSLLPPKYQITSWSYSDRKKTLGSSTPPLPDSDAVIFIGLGDNAVKHKVLVASKHQDSSPRQQISFSRRNAPAPSSRAAGKSLLHVG